MSQNKIDQYRRDLKWIDEQLEEVIGEKWKIEKQFEQLSDWRRTVEHKIAELKLEELGVSLEEIYDENRGEES
jgi:hypothetical protein